MMEQNSVSQIEQPGHWGQRLFGTNLGGLVLILVGVAFAAVNLLGNGRLENWWSFFILLPGVLFLGLWRVAGIRNGRFSFLSRSSSGIGLVIVTVALMFLLNLDWEVWWPMMIIMPGMAFWMVGGARGSVGGTAVLRFGCWLGFTMFFLGLTFLVDQLNLINLQAIFGDFHWWSFFVLIPGIGAFVEGFRVMRQSNSAAMILLVAGVWIVSSGLMEIFAPNWQSWEGMVGIGLIGTGLLSRGWLFIQPKTD